MSRDEIRSVEKKLKDLRSEIKDLERSLKPEHQQVADDLHTVYKKICRLNKKGAFSESAQVIEASFKILDRADKLPIDEKDNGVYEDEPEPTFWFDDARKSAATLELIAQIVAEISKNCAKVNCACESVSESVVNVNTRCSTCGESIPRGTDARWINAKAKSVCFICADILQGRLHPKLVAANKINDKVYEAYWYSNELEYNRARQTLNLAKVWCLEASSF